MNPDGSVVLSLSQQVVWAISTIWPIVIAVVIKPTWSEGTKALVGFLLAVLLAAAGIYFDGRFSLQNIGATCALVFITSAVLYARFWRPTGVAPAVERNVNP